MQEATQDMRAEALNGYRWNGALIDVQRYGEGHINDTYCVETQSPVGRRTRYILQRINRSVFRDVDALMENIAGVTAYLEHRIQQDGGNPYRETLNLLLTRDGKPYFTDSQGGAWRVYLFVEDTFCLQLAETPEQFRESACIFGRFQRLLANYPAHTLHETIPHFHDTVRRYDALMTAAAADPLGRAAAVAEELAFARARRADCGRLIAAQYRGELPIRVTHNDTKLNNVLMDRATGKALCVIDLDTVMPGLAANDFGDSIRFGANHSAEDERDLSKVRFSLPLYEVYLDGYLEAVGNALTPAELDSLPWGAKLMTLECGMRFLTDYLDGDRYFKISRDSQNLDRCRTQFKLVADMEQSWDAMLRILSSHRPDRKNA